MIEINTLTPHPDNPRKITDAQMDKLKESIRRDPEFMVLRPMVIDEDGTVLGGNQRLRAITELGMQEVPDSWVVKAGDLTDEQKRRFILVDNAPGGMAGEWDVDLLANEWELPELEELGFDASELLEVQKIAWDEEGNIVDDEIDEKRFKSNLKVDVVLSVEVLEVFEKAIKHSGEVNRAEAIKKICEVFLEKG